MRFFSGLKRKHVKILLIVFLTTVFIMFNLEFLSSYRQVLFNNNCLNRKSENFNLNYTTLNPKYSICHPNTKIQLLLFVFVVIAPDKFEKRMIIRNTWANMTVFKDMKVVFVVGLSKNSHVNTQIKQEFDFHKDLIQIDFIDSYHKLTSKIILSFKWISNYCYNSKFILRINDDVFVNTFYLLDYLNALNYEKNRLYGLVESNAVPERNPNNKFYVSYDAFYNSKYDNYVEGINIDIF